MQKAKEYLEHADECRALAQKMPPGSARERVLKMAQTWEVLAHEHERTIRATSKADTFADAETEKGNWIGSPAPLPAE